MARKPILAATGVLVALAALSANPPQPALPPLPANPLGPLVQPPPLAPSAPPLARIPVDLPALPPAPKSQLPAPLPFAQPDPPPAGLLVPVAPPANLVPPVPGDLPPLRFEPVTPVAPASPPPSQILEPVSAVHRFAGTYLGGTASRAVVYAEADGKAEVLVYALDNTKEPLARCAVPADKPVIRVGVIHFEGEFSVARAVKQTFHDGRAFVLAARELAVVGIEGRAEWSFALPGRADNGERFVALAGFDRGTVLIASSELLKDGKSTGRVYALDSATGKQVAFWKFEGGFDAHALFAVDAQSRVLFANSGSAVRLLQLDRAEPPAQAEHGSAVAHLSAANKMAFFGAPSGALVSDGRENWHLTREAAGTAPAGFAVAPNGARAFVPLRDLQSGQHRLAAYKVGAFVAPEWALNVPKALTAPPVARGGSVYFAAGNVLYRASATTGEVHWKHTLALEPRDALTGMAFDGDALVAWGGGVVARVADPPAVPVAPAPRERPRQVFNFSQGVFGSQ